MSTNTGISSMQNDFSFVNVGSFGTLSLSELDSAIHENPSPVVTSTVSGISMLSAVLNKYWLLVVLGIAFLIGYYLYIEKKV